MTYRGYAGTSTSTDWNVQHGESSVAMQLEIVAMYTNNKLTLAQAAQALYRAQVQTSGPGSGSLSDFLRMLGHRMHPDDVAAIEVGFEGKEDAWLNAGNFPIGYYSKFADNYHFYKTQPVTAADVDPHPFAPSGAGYADTFRECLAGNCACGKYPKKQV